MITAERILGLEARRTELMIEGDADALAALLHPRCRYIHSTGAVDTREGYLTKLRDGVFAYRAIEATEQEVTLTESVATVVFRMDARIVVSGAERAASSRCAAVWSRTEPPELLSFQATPLQV